MNHHFDVVVIGGGAAGMACAIHAAENRRNVLLIEKADHPGRKILASGNGRCNLMNSGDLRYYGDPGFARRVFDSCSRNDLVSFFHHYGLFLREESDGRIYPATNQAASVVSVLKNAMDITSVQTVMNSPVSSVLKNRDRGFRIRTENGNEFSTGRLVVCCGGSAHPKLGGCGDGYRILAGLGHTMIGEKPSLVPLITDKKSISGLSGTRIRCGVSLLKGNVPVHSEEGEVLFTDYGISGICVMQCARFAEPPDASLQLDLLRNIFTEPKDAVPELKRRRLLFSSGSPLWLLNGLLPERISYAVMKQAGIPLKGETASEISDQMLERIIRTASGYRILIISTKGMDQAQVTAGGIDCSEFNPSTMESRIVPGLYAAGEVLNVDGDCGGYNLMFAFASGITAGSAV